MFKSPDKNIDSEIIYSGRNGLYSVNKGSHLKQVVFLVSYQNRNRVLEWGLPVVRVCLQDTVTVHTILQRTGGRAEASPKWIPVLYVT